MDYNEILKNLVKPIIAAATIALLLFKIIFHVVVVHGTSMEPSFHSGDILILNHLTYEPDFGDIVVFKHGDRDILIKRIIGLPGDSLEIQDSTVIRNGKALEEDYIIDGVFGDGDMTGPVIVENGHIFVLGDNRPDSYDSRHSGVGQVADDDILGGVVFRLWNIGKERVV